MGIEKDLVEPTLGNVALLNLDQTPESRRMAMIEVAMHLDELAKLPPLSAGAATIMRMVDGMEPAWGDRHTWYRVMAEGLRGKANETYRA